MQCTNCAATLPDEDIYCEECGLRLDTIPAAEAGEARYERVLSPECAGISDRGLKRSRNEDRFMVGKSDTGWVLVVCDGVSSSEDSQRAAGLAAEITAERLLASQSIESAIEAAAHAVKELPGIEKTSDPASTTIVAAFVANNEITLAWLGDSRAYWIAASGETRQLTTDHSWLNGVLSNGSLAPDQAEASPHAHAITRWLGSDSDDMHPELKHVGIEGPGTLMLCSDGLWNYTAKASEIGAMVNEGGDAFTTARRLVEFALSRGGHDNVTVAVLRLGEQNGDGIQS